MNLINYYSGLKSVSDGLAEQGCTLLAWFEQALNKQGEIGFGVTCEEV